MMIKKIKRRKRSKKPYFGKDAHNAIVKYQNEPDKEIRDEIYVKDILPAFSKLSENLIFIHRFASSKEDYVILKNDCVSFLFETLNKFDPSRGTKAFSYFNVVAKNWLIIQSKKKTKNNRRVVSIDDTQSLTYSDAATIENYSIAAMQDFKIMKRESRDSLFEMMNVIKGRLKSENEKACIESIITLFTNIDDLDLLNKRAIFIYMRELSGLNPKQLSVSMSSIRKHYRELVKDGDFDIFFWGA
jgi:hypothetical protein